MAATSLKSGDSWEAQMDLAERWSEAGGFGNKRFAMPFLKKANAMEARLKANGIPHPLETMVYGEHA